MDKFDCLRNDLINLKVVMDKRDFIVFVTPFKQDLGIFLDDDTCVWASGDDLLYMSLSKYGLLLKLVDGFHTFQFKHIVSVKVKSCE